jgi:hypothetical protein
MFWEILTLLWTFIKFYKIDFQKISVWVNICEFINIGIFKFYSDFWCFLSNFSDSSRVADKVIRNSVFISKIQPWPAPDSNISPNPNLKRMFRCPEAGVTPSDLEAMKGLWVAPQNRSGSKWPRYAGPTLRRLSDPERLWVARGARFTLRDLKPLEWLWGARVTSRRRSDPEMPK